MGDPVAIVIAVVVTTVVALMFTRVDYKGRTVFRGPLASRCFEEPAKPDHVGGYCAVLRWKPAFSTTYTLRAGPFPTKRERDAWVAEMLRECGYREPSFWEFWRWTEVDYKPFLAKAEPSHGA